MGRVLVWAIVAMASVAAAAPRPGANHHAGDDSFVAMFGRAPDAGDSEALRMHTHLVWVRAGLAAAPATSAALAGRRAELLGYLDDYIAKGITPRNTYVGWRSPVFVDRDGNVCAVGYLIERTAGRALTDRIARDHRLAFLEDIAAAEPDVRAWIAASGFTLDELATIQPAYQEPAIETWRTWSEARRTDGAYEVAGITGTGTIAKGHMEGAWKVIGSDGALVGSGTFTRGAGRWTSVYPGGARHAEGRYLRDRAQGRWRIYHPSGRLAAEGVLDDGVRVGEWRLYHDTPAQALLARGRFDRAGKVTGRWEHFDASGALVATTWEETPAQWDDHTLSTTGGQGFVVDVVPKDGVEERHHIGMPHARTAHTTLLRHGEHTLIAYEVAGATMMFDADGNQLVHDDERDAWTSKRCHWSEKRKAVARSGDVARLAGLLFQDYARRAGKMDDFGAGYVENFQPACDRARPVHASRAAAYSALLAARAAVRAPVTFTAVVEEDPQNPTTAIVDDPDDPSDDDDARDLVDQLVSGMAMYAEWRHVDGVFAGLFATIPGRFTRSWAGSDPEAP